MIRWVTSSDVLLRPLPRWPAGARGRQQVTFADVVTPIRRFSPAAIITAPKDATYVAVPVHVIKPAVEWTLAFLTALGLRRTPESLDCDDFSLELDRTLNRMCALAGIEAAPLCGCLVVDQRTAWANVPAGGRHQVCGVLTELGLVAVESQSIHAEYTPFEAYPNRGFVCSADNF